MSPQSARVRLVLASASPRRAELLRLAGYAFRVQPAPVDDDGPMPTDLSAVQVAEARARQKALAVAALHTPFDEEWVLGADTVVAVGNRLLGKPTNRDHAAEMLAALAGQTHTVVTGVTLVSPTGVADTRSAQAAVRLEPLSPDRLAAYLDSNLWRGKAGAYGFQDRAPAGLTLTLQTGEESTVIGLPMGLLAAMLNRER